MSVPVDAVVIGGGVQGLWVLNDLVRRNFRACLITNGPLGAGQTLQSHVYLHRGHLYEKRELVERIAQAQPAWQGLIQRSNIQTQSRRPLWVLPASATEKHLDAWRDSGLQFRETELPELFRQGEFANQSTSCRVFETQETWLDGEALIGTLSAKVLSAIRTGRVEKIDVRHGAVRSVEVMLEHGEPLVLRPRFVVLAAGVGNQQLLRNALTFNSQSEDDHLRSSVASLQRLRASQMVVVRGRSLPPLGCIAPRKLFLVSNRDGSDVVWINSHEIDGLAATGDANVMPPVDPNRLKANLDTLHAAVPQLKAMDVTYGVYTCLKSERNVNQAWVPDSEYIEHLGRPSLNLRVVWPSKLTLAPVASKRIVSLISRQLSHPNGSSENLVTLPGVPPPVGVSPWRATKCMPLESLMAQHKLN